MSDQPICAVCYRPIDDYDWYVEVRRDSVSPFHLKRAHHTCPPERDDD